MTNKSAAQAGLQASVLPSEEEFIALTKHLRTKKEQYRWLSQNMKTIPDQVQNKSKVDNHTRSGIPKAEALEEVQRALQKIKHMGCDLVGECRACAAHDSLHKIKELLK